MDFPNITAPNPRRNTTVAEGHRLAELILRAGIDATPRLFADGTYAMAAMIPENAAVALTDLPGWAIDEYDGSTTLESLGVDPAADRVYVQVWLVQRKNFYDVADVLRLVDAGVSLAAALA